MNEPRTIVIAPDSFKGSATAAVIARAIADGWTSVRPRDHVILASMADGGEGTIDAFELAVPAARRMPVIVNGPDGRPVSTSWLLLPPTDEFPGGVGVVELASTSGITLLDELVPLDAHTLGFGEAIADALDHGVSRLLLAIGGSASTDGGVGALAALGARFANAQGRPVRLGNRGLGSLARVDLDALRTVPDGGAVILSDVTNPLLGPRGAAAVFGPQKGANGQQVLGLESGLVRLERLMRAARPGVRASTPGAGAAGGTGFGLLAWGATPAAGAEAVGSALGLPTLVAGADIVVTGEGRFDAQSAAGKVPAYVARLAASAGVRAFLVAGAIETEEVPFDAAISLTDLAGGPADAMADPARWARAAGAHLAERTS
ncbi:glycerate kinase [Diaminobutyricibacter tongyongensis]|uniref:Glycerate kinase n=1 Tax=Leifsonia tongyongensis TaxID=1268043 RepID=A0A6L9Y3L7_9MICO|nr:glycerate kinase [Diaminobutyricibacter tongyongensis]NEN07937.1 glycerate kinase [Diaminobutyricibacter tongyongensis]